ncbi:hypothetical protein MTR_5g036870 [Medicago truncatula]|uniref:Uncharacterized protein n=1 Tax=Medicago truncatula TaxID=3880 RepID=G7K6Y1_MEDTR|nr:hypothetical protein MTR_5g036870 [Medicago truncatula]
MEEEMPNACPHEHLSRFYETCQYYVPPANVTEDQKKLRRFAFTLIGRRLQPRRSMVIGTFLNRFKQVLLEDDGDDLDDSNKEHYPPFVIPKKMTNFKWVLGARFGTKMSSRKQLPTMLSTIGLV